MTINNITMTRTGNKFTFNGEELTMLYTAFTTRLNDITENYTSDQMMGLYKKEIALLEQITETL